MAKKDKTTKEELEEKPTDETPEVDATPTEEGKTEETPTPETSEETPIEELTEEEIKEDQAEMELLKDTLEVEPQNLTDEQKEVIRRNAGKLPEEQKEFYKEILKSPEPEPEPEPTPEPDLKKKLSASARENQKILAKNRVLNKALSDTDEIPDPTEEELQAEFKEDWDVMSEVERTFAKETVISRRWRGRIKEAQDQAKKIEKWNESVDAFIGDPKVLIGNPELEGKQEEFATFAKEESNNSVPFKILVGAFLHEQSQAKKPNKGAMFPTGSGGPNDKPQPHSDILTVEEGRKLRETDYGKWKELLRAGKIAKE